MSHLGLFGLIIAAAIPWGTGVLNQTPEWYASQEARTLADSVIQHQAPDGGWPKNTDLGTPPPPAASRASAPADVTSSTIDNDGTTMPMQFLALVATRPVIPAIERRPARFDTSRRHYRIGGGRSSFRARGYSRNHLYDGARSMADRAADAGTSTPDSCVAAPAAQGRAAWAGIDRSATQIKQTAVSRLGARSTTRRRGRRRGRARTPPALSGRERRHLPVSHGHERPQRRNRAAKRRPRGSYSMGRNH